MSGWCVMGEWALGRVRLSGPRVLGVQGLSAGRSVALSCCHNSIQITAK